MTKLNFCSCHLLVSVKICCFFTLDYIKLFPDQIVFDFRAVDHLKLLICQAVVILNSGFTVVTLFCHVFSLILNYFSQQTCVDYISANQFRDIVWDRLQELFDLSYSFGHKDLNVRDGMWFTTSYFFSSFQKSIFSIGAETIGQRFPHAWGWGYFFCEYCIYSLCIHLSHIEMDVLLQSMTFWFFKSSANSSITCMALCNFW